MNKEEMIEKLGSLIANADCGKHHDCSNCDDKDYMFCFHRHIAVSLYNSGVRILPDGDIIMSKEMYSKICSKPNVAHTDSIEGSENDFSAVLEQARKEAAKDILSDLSGLLKWYTHTKENINLYEFYCNKYGVEK